MLCLAGLEATCCQTTGTDHIDSWEGEVAGAPCQTQGSLSGPAPQQQVGSSVPEVEKSFISCVAALTVTGSLVSTAEAVSS